MSNLKDQIAKVVTAAHKAVYDASGGRIGGKGLGMPVVKLTTTGRKSGKTRETMLTTPLQIDDAVVLVASYGGDDRHPTWFLNLRDDPNVHLELAGRSFDATARIASGAERTSLWDQLTADHGNYAGYQKRTDREIPVIVCEPRP